MADSDAIQHSAAENLFVRRATGLVKGWSAYDGFIYSAIAVTPMILGLYIFTYGPFIPKGSLLWAVIASGVFIMFEAFVYAALISAIPRAGGDYVWQSRILHGSIGFVLAVTGWWFIMWHWTPIYSGVFVREVVDPLSRLLGAPGVAEWFLTRNGTFASCLIVIGLVAGLIAMGMRGYSKLQKVCFYIGMTGFVIVFVLLLTHSRSDFVHAFNSQATDLYGAGPGAYGDIIKNGGDVQTSVTGFDAGATLLMIPIVVFWNLWANWGATLYGEIRGANDFRKNFLAMAGGLALSVTLTVVLFVLIAKTMGWGFYNAANNVYWAGDGPLGTSWHYPVLSTAALMGSRVLEVILVLMMSAWFVGYVGNLFLSSTRVVFAAAFDRLLPEKAAHVSMRRHVPVGALVLTCGPAIVISALYAYWTPFATYTFDATIPVAVMYLGTTLSCALLPWRARRVYLASPLARWEWRGIPLVTVGSVVFGGFLVFNIVYWVKDSVYGVNNRDSALYMALLYGAAIVIYVIAKIVRGREGVSLDRIQSEIPVE
jgi:basic amino acid/polyamine antiporter, APA family